MPEPLIVLEVGDYVLYTSGRVHWKIEAIRQHIFVIRSGQTGRIAHALKSDLRLYMKHDAVKETAA